MKNVERKKMITAEIEDNKQKLKKKKNTKNKIGFLEENWRKEIGFPHLKDLYKNWKISKNLNQLLMINQLNLSETIDWKNV